MTLLLITLPTRADARPIAAWLADRLDAAGMALREALDHGRRQRDAADTRRALSQLDERTLHDLGLHRSEIGSLAAEMSGLARAERQMVLLAMSRGL